MKPFLTLIITCFLTGISFATPKDTPLVSPLSIFDYFHQDEVLEMAIFADFSKLIDQKLESEEYEAANIKLINPKGKLSSFPVKIKPRGKFRRRVCDFPPLKLKFKKDFLLENGLDTFNKLKLVTHCTGDPSSNKEALLKEYLAYKMLNTLTNNSFRVQLLYITYVDISGKRENVSSFGFILEEDEQVAHRLGGILLEQFSTQEAELDREQAGMVSMFQYMIGNPDWDLAMNRNLKMVVNPISGKISLIPYDFDFSGWVSPNYLKDQDRLKHDNERKLQGIQLTDVELESLKSNFRSKKATFMESIEKSSYLEKSSQKKLRKYLDEFYEELEELGAGS
jgi:hypothetical protein